VNSGTTIIAGEMTGRCIYAMEISPATVDMAVERWQNFTGEQAIMEDSGEYFPSIKKRYRLKSEPSMIDQ